MNLKFKLWGILLFSSIILNAQDKIDSDLRPMETDGWYKYQGSEKLNAEAFLKNYKEELGLSSTDTYSLKSISKGVDGSKHYHYQQMYRSFPVEAGELILHLRDNAVYLVNGEIISGLNTSISPRLDESAAFRKALEYFPAELYRWEIDGQIRPKGELCLLDKNFSKDPEGYRLSWKYDIHTSGPEERNWVYVDAENGALNLALNRIHTHDTGTVVTKYSGTNPIYTTYNNDSSKYILHDSLSGGGVFTYNMEQRTNKSTAIDFYDDDNYWNNFNAEYDEAAGDAHWGAESVLFYFKDHYNRLSYDDLNSPLVSFVHFDSNYVNAFWNGQEMTYGDGNGNAFTPLTSLDIVAHEIVHGVTQFSANLIYQGESGALNESFSDIFGAAIEFAYDSAGGDWKMGEDIMNTGNGIRNLRNPTLFNDPDTYLGVNWNSGLFIDNGYVHSHSGVQNFWYYLLSDGDTGINDNNDAYDIEGIGFQKAADIAYYNLTNYLTRFSNYQDARMGAMQSAINLYGACSNEYIQTTNAWYATGVGGPAGTIDLSLDGLLLPQRACSLGSSEVVTFMVRNNSCSQSIPAGTNLTLNYSINGGLINTINTTLSNILAPDSVVYLNHTQLADLSQTGNYDFNASIDYTPDTLNYNNLIDMRVKHEPFQNADWKLLKVLSPLSGCELGDSTQIQLSAVFLGCDSLAAGTNINLDYSLAGNTQILSHGLSKSVHYGDTVVLNYSSLENLNARGRYSFNFTLVFPADPNINNNRIVNHGVLKPYELLGGKIGFEDFAYSDSLIISHPINNSSRRNSIASQGNRGLEIIGGPLVNYAGPFIVPRTDSTVWDVNPLFRSTLCTCIDATGEGSLALHFDLRQAYTRLIRNLRSESSNSPYSSSMRVLANGQPVSGTFSPATFDADTFQREIVNLDAYAGQYFELCFETHLMVSERNNSITYDGDIINLDNIFLSSSSINLTENTILNNGDWGVYPNPSEGSFLINWSQAKAGLYRMSLIDTQGKILYRRSIQTQAGNQDWEFHTDLKPGMYFLQVQKPDGSVVSEQMLIN